MLWELKKHILTCVTLCSFASLKHSPTCYSFAIYDSRVLVPDKRFLVSFGLRRDAPRFPAQQIVAITPRYENKSVGGENSFDAAVRRHVGDEYVRPTMHEYVYI